MPYTAALTHRSPQLPNRPFCCVNFSADVTAAVVLPTGMISTAHMACGELWCSRLRSTQLCNHPDFRHARVGDINIPDEAFLSPPAAVCVCVCLGAVPCRTFMLYALNDQYVALDTISDSKQTGCVALRQHTDVSDLRKHNTSIGMQNEIRPIPTSAAIVRGLLTPLHSRL